MTTQQALSRRLGRACCGLAVAATLATSACAAGQRAQTAEQKPTLDGTEASVGQIDLRGIAIVPPTTPSYAPGASVQLRLVIVNSGRSSDQLTGITSTAITSWGSYASAAAAQAAQAPTPAAPAAGSSASAGVATSPAAGGASSGSSSSGSSSTVPASTGPSSGASAASSSKSKSAKSASSAAGSSASSGSTSPSVATPTTSTAPRPTPSRSVTIAVGGTASWGVPDSKQVLVLADLKQRLFPGSTVRLTFSFAKAGTVTATVPVALSQSPKYSTIPAQSQPSDEPTG